MTQLAVCYGLNAVPAGGGGGSSTRSLAVSGAVPAVGSGFGLASEPVAPVAVPGPVLCAGINKRGGNCGARPANGSELCIGHLRSAGRL